MMTKSLTSIDRRLNYFQKRKLKALNNTEKYKKPAQVRKKQYPFSECGHLFSSYKAYRVQNSNYFNFLNRKPESSISFYDFLKLPKNERRVKKPIPKRYFQQKNELKKALATPKWVNVDEMCKIYINCPDGHHVDHIIPLNHPDVCGLNVPWNLQYLTKEKNLKKSNKFKPFKKLKLVE